MSNKGDNAVTETKSVTCRYGITYTVTFIGAPGARMRAFELMAHCCCWVCHNRDCKTPRNEVLSDCTKVCELWTKKHYCEK